MGERWLGGRKWVEVRKEGIEWTLLRAKREGGMSSEKEGVS